LHLHAQRRERLGIEVLQLGRDEHARSEFDGRGGDVAILRIRLADHAIGRGYGNQRRWEILANEGKGPGFDTITLRSFDVAQPLVFDQRGPLRDEHLVPRQL
jgi:hypothetical protein